MHTRAQHAIAVCARNCFGSSGPLPGVSRQYVPEERSCVKRRKVLWCSQRCAGQSLDRQTLKRLPKNKKEVASSIAMMLDEKTGQAGQTGQPGDEEVWMSYSDVAMMKSGHKAMTGPAVPADDDVACENTEAHIFDIANSARVVVVVVVLVVVVVVVVVG